MRQAWYRDNREHTHIDYTSYDIWSPNGCRHRLEYCWQGWPPAAIVLAGCRLAAMLTLRPARCWPLRHGCRRYAAIVATPRPPILPHAITTCFHTVMPRPQPLRHTYIYATYAYIRHYTPPYTEIAGLKIFIDKSCLAIALSYATYTYKCFFFFLPQH